MASGHFSGNDHMVTLKVSYEGSVRRAKMPLRDMLPRVFEDHIKTFLHIPPNSRARMERWSDSLGAFVELDSDNAPVYKQLYRAAKAKSKLKVRVTLLNQAEMERTIPKPVTVEDEPEVAPLPGRDLLEAISYRREEPEPEPEPELKPIPPPIPEMFEAPEATGPAETVRELSSDELSSEFFSEIEPPAEKLISTLPSMELPLRTLPPAEPAEEPLPDVPDVPDVPAELAEPAEPASEVNEASSMKKATRDLVDLIREEQASQAPSWTEPLPWYWSKGPIQNPTSGLFNTLASTCPSFSICCNKCDRNVSDAHYHCSTCDDGDFDLCPSCVDQGHTCKSDDHWLIKRTMVGGQLVCSSTETIAPKQKEAEVHASKDVKQETTDSSSEKPRPASPAAVPTAPSTGLPGPFTPYVAPIVVPRWLIRTCNSCVQEYTELEFLHCKTCEDFDLCKQCFARDEHGHHPKHVFAPAVAGSEMPAHITAKLGAGRNKSHHAICDGCDSHITGVRHKCLDCPDWDYCDQCIAVAEVDHASHRFVPIYEPLDSIRPPSTPQPIHISICCDGPLCSSSHGDPTYIRGIRYKCAVCNDTDFCANCEASPLNEHNKTHPLIKFKTPVRHVNVTTTGEHQNGKRMPLMGDRVRSNSSSTRSHCSGVSNTINVVQTVVDVKPEEVSAHQFAHQQAEPAAAEKECKAEPEEAVDMAAIPPPPTAPTVSDESLQAVFLRDSVPDGTILPSNHVFEQTWWLRNEGNVPWPAGCSVKFVGGDYMGHVDSAHPAGISELVSASESTICYAPLAPRQAFPFTVLLRTPLRAGRITSYWRLTTPEGLKFGHRLWCEVNVRATAPATPVPEATPLELPQTEAPSQTSSVMIFPKLEAESMHSVADEKPESSISGGPSVKDEQSDSVEAEDWDGSDDDFMTDEEYDILDASDEENIEEHLRNARK